MKIGILETGLVPEGFEERHGNYASMFEKLLDGHNLSFTNYSVVNNVFPESIFSEEGWIISGSRHGAYEDHDWIPPLEEFLRHAYANHVPIVGICFGHQILAQALGGKVEKFINGWAVGHTRYNIDGNGDTALFAMHQDQVTELPRDAEVFASNSFCANAGLAYKGSALSYQPHPEFTPGFLSDLIKLRGGKTFSSELAHDALSKIQIPHDSQKIGEHIASFLKQHQLERTAPPV